MLDDPVHFKNIYRYAYDFARVWYITHIWWKESRNVLLVNQEPLCFENSKCLCEQFNTYEFRLLLIDMKIDSHELYIYCMYTLLINDINKRISGMYSFHIFFEQL